MSDTYAISQLISWSATGSVAIAAQHTAVPEPAYFSLGFEAYVGFRVSHID